MKIYVINLDRSLDRLTAIANQLLAFNLPFERFPAIDGTTLDLATISENYGVTIAAPPDRPLHAGQIGCFLSHALLLRKIADRPEPIACVLEDDAVLKPDFREVITAVEAADAWGVLKLESADIKQRGIVLSSICNRKLVYNPWPAIGSGCYCMTREAAQRLGRRLVFMDNAIDRILYDTRSTGVKVKEIWPYPVTQDKRFPSLVRLKSKVKFPKKRWQKRLRVWRGYYSLVREYGWLSSLQLVSIANLITQ